MPLGQVCQNSYFNISYQINKQLFSKNVAVIFNFCESHGRYAAQNNFLPFFFVEHYLISILFYFQVFYTPIFWKIGSFLNMCVPVGGSVSCSRVSPQSWY